MAFRLHPGEPLAAGIRRIVDEELASAIDALEGRGPAERDAAVHDARKRLKKARAAVRLVRFDVGRDVQRRETAELRDAARRLSGARDASVLLETLAELEATSDAALPAPAVAELRAILERRRAELHAAALGDGDALGEVVAAIAGVRERLPGWPLEDESFAGAGRGLRRIARRGRAAMRAAIDEADDEAWHDWRKRVKDLWYALRILEPVAPEHLKPLVADADRLSDVLGDHNDIAVLGDALAEHAAALDPGQVALVRAALERRRDELRLAAVPLGRRLYAERPGRLVGRIAALWDARDAEDAAGALWLEPVVAARVRELLAAKPSADAAGKRRIGADLRDLGFRPSDFADQVPRRRGGFTAEDFDALLVAGTVRIGAPPAPPAPVGEAAPPPSANGGPHDDARDPRPVSATALLHDGVRLALSTARWAASRLPRP